MAQTNTIKTSGGDYSGVASWESDLPATLTDDEIGELYFEEDLGTTRLNIQISNCAGYRITLKAADSAKHSGYYEADKAGLICDDYYGVIRIYSTPIVTIDGLTICEDSSAPSSGHHCGINVYKLQDHIIKDCVITKTNGQGTEADSYGIKLEDRTSTAGTIVLVNNIVDNFYGGYKIWRPFTAGEIVCYNNLAYGYNASGYGFYFDAYATSDTLSLYNNIAEGSGTSYDCAGNFTGFTTYVHDNNMSSDANSPDSAHQSKTATFENEGSSDFRLDSTDTEAIDAGTDLSADSYYSFSVDHIGNSRTASNWDIGPNEYQAPAGNTVELPVKALTLTTYAPSVVVTEHNTVELPLEALTVTTYAPSVVVTEHNTVELPLEALSVTTYAPSVVVTEHNTVELPLAELSVTTYAPSVVVTEHNTVELPLEALTVTTYAPSVVVTEHNSVELPLATMTVTTYAPTISVGASNTVELPLATMTVTTYAPSVVVTEHNTVELPLEALTVTTYAPSVVVTEHNFVELPLATMTVTTYAPTVTTSDPNTVELPVKALTLTTYAPSVVVTEHSFVELPLEALTLTTYAPSVVVTEHSFVELPLAALTLTTYAPSAVVTVIGLSDVEAIVSLSGTFSTTEALSGEFDADQALSGEFDNDESLGGSVQ